MKSNSVFCTNFAEGYRIVGPKLSGEVASSPLPDCARLPCGPFVLDGKLKALGEG